MTRARPFSLSESGATRRRLMLRGELDMAGAPELEAAIERACDDGVSEIEIDLRELDFIDSSGLRAILLAREMCAQAGRGFFLVPAMRSSPRMLFETAGLVDKLPWRPRRIRPRGTGRSPVPPERVRDPQRRREI